MIRRLDCELQDRHYSGFRARSPRPGAAAPPAQPAVPASPLLTGSGLALGAFLLLAGQDAAIKLLTATLDLPLILCVRSLAILGLGLAAGGRDLLPAVFRSPVRALLLRRAIVTLGAWSAYFTAARSLPLGQLAAFQFLAPLLVVLAAGWLLGEGSGWRHRLLVLLGTAGALVSGGSLGIAWQPALLLALVAAMLWAYAVILTRRIAHTEGPLVQLTATHLMFLAVMAPLALQAEVMPTTTELPLLLLVAVLGGIGQFALFSAARHLPAPVMAPLEYTTLLWNFLLGYVVWGNIPGPSILVGAGLIALSCAGLLAGMRRAGALPGAAGTGGRDGR